MHAVGVLRPLRKFVGIERVSLLQLCHVFGVLEKEGLERQVSHVSKEASHFTWEARTVLGSTYCSIRVLEARQSLLRGRPCLGGGHSLDSGFDDVTPQLLMLSAQQHQHSG